MFGNVAEKGFQSDRFGVFEWAALKEFRVMKASCNLDEIYGPEKCSGEKHNLLMWFRDLGVTILI